MLNTPAKRFYKTATSQAVQGGFGIFLDGRMVSTPAGEELFVPTNALATAIAREWMDQKEDIRPDSMPMMRLACTAIDKVRLNRADISEQVSSYGGSDLLCYRADGPDELVVRQHKAWQSYLDWARNELRASLEVTNGIVHIPQSDATLDALGKAVEGHDDFELTALAEITQVTGSLVLGLSVSRGNTNWDQAFEASQVDEVWQVERWGEDHEASERRRNRHEDVKSAVRFLELVRDGADGTPV